jgi:hypothetical protein
LGLSSGDFNGDGFSDFALSTHLGDANSSTGSCQIFLVLCSPGTPVSCTVSDIAKTTSNDTNISTTVACPSNLAAGDFNGDGRDDLANVSDIGTFDNKGNETNFKGLVEIRLNQGGGFNDAPDQSLSLNMGSFANSQMAQVVAKDIDGCGGPDIAFTGQVYNAIGEDLITSFEFQAAVAFNPNEAPVADAGPDNGKQVNGGIQIGGNPTCQDPTNDFMQITWTQISGGPATLNDPTAANPIVTSFSGGDAVFQVTCTDPCGLSGSDTVSVSLFLQGSGCSLGWTSNASPDREVLSWGLIMIVFGVLNWKRLRRF